MTGPPFGLQLYEALTRRRALEALTARLDYAQVQQFKAADRRGLIRLFAGSDGEFIERLRSDTVEELADYLVSSREREGSSTLMLLLFGLQW